MRPYARPLVTLGFLSLAEVALRALSPWPLKAVVDHVIGRDPLPAWLQSLAPPLSANPHVRALAVILLLGLVAQLAHQLVLMLHTRLHVRIGSAWSSAFAHGCSHTCRASRSRTTTARHAGTPCSGSRRMPPASSSCS
jgi:hypothetical protein